MKTDQKTHAISDETLQLLLTTLEAHMFSLDGYNNEDVMSALDKLRADVDAAPSTESQQWEFIDSMGADCQLKPGPTCAFVMGVDEVCRRHGRSIHAFGYSADLHIGDYDAQDIQSLSRASDFSKCI